MLQFSTRKARWQTRWSSLDLDIYFATTGPQDGVELYIWSLKSSFRVFGVYKYVVLTGKEPEGKIRDSRFRFLQLR